MKKLGFLLAVALVLVICVMAAAESLSPVQETTTQVVRITVDGGYDITSVRTVRMAKSGGSLVPENGNSHWTWYLGLKRYWVQSGVCSDSGIIQFRIPEEDWVGTGVGLPVWTVTNTNSMGTNPYDFTYEREEWNDCRGISLQPLWSVEEETVTGSNTYKIRAEYNGKVYESTETVTFKSIEFPTGMAMTVREADLSTNTAGASVPLTDGGFTLVSGKDYVFTSTFTGKQPVSDNSFFMNGGLEPGLEEYGRYDDRFRRQDGSYVWNDHQQVFAAKETGTYYFTPSLSVGMSNLSACNGYTIRISDASGNIPNPKLESAEREMTWYTGLSTDWPENGGVYSLRSFGQMWVPDHVRDYSDLEIDWQLVHVSGPDNFALHCDPNDEWLDSYFYGEVEPKSGTLTAGDSEYTLLATYKGVTYEGTLRIHTRAISAVPAGMTVDIAEFDPDTLQIGNYTTVRNGEDMLLQEGKVYVLRGLLDGGAFSGENLWLNLDGNAGWDEGDRWAYRDSQGDGIFHGNNMVVAGNTPGTYPAGVSLSLENTNLEAWMRLKMKVADTSGNVPELKPALYGEYPWTDGFADAIDYPIYLGVSTDSRQRVWTDDGFIHIFVDNREQLLAEYGGEPVWSVRQTSGSLDYSVFSNDTQIWSHLNTYPTAPTEAVFEVSCTWGGETATKTVRVHVAEPDFTLPGDLDNLPDTIEAKVGDTLTLAPEAIPAAQAYGGIEPRFFAANSLCDFADFTMMLENRGTFMIREAGTFTDVVGVRIGSLMVTKEVSFLVADAGGNIPGPKLDTAEREMTWYTGLSTNWPENGGVYSQRSFGQMWSPERVRDYSDLEIDWQLVHVSGPDNFVLCYEPTDDWLDSYFYAEVEPGSGTLTAGDSEYTMRATYKGVTYEGTLRIHTTDLSAAPAGMTVDIAEFDPDTLQIGSYSTVRNGEDMLLQEGKVYVLRGLLAGGDPGSENLWLNMDSNAGWDERDRWEYTDPQGNNLFHGNNMVVAGNTPGTYGTVMSLSLEDTNLEACMRLKMKVADLSGNVPEAELDIGGEYYFGSAVDYSGVGVYFVASDLPLDSQEDDVLSCGSELFWFGVLNGDDIPEGIGEPYYSVELLSGDAEYECVRNDQNVIVRLTEMPGPGEVVFRTVYDLAGNARTQDVHVLFVELENRPEGVETDLGTVWKKGETFPLPAPIRFRDGWDVGDGISTSLLCDEEAFWDAIDWSDFTVAQTGVFEVRLIAQSWNLYMAKTVRLVFTNEDGTIPKADYQSCGRIWTLPENLETIESEAFAGIPMKEADIPATVTFIAEDAFDGCGLCAIYAHSQSVIDYAVRHGIPAVVD